MLTEEIIEIVELATEVLLKEIPKYINSKDKYALTKFMNDKVTLEKIGICNGVSKLIDEKLHKIHKDICIIQTDTLSKFKNDIINNINKEYIIPYKSINRNKRK